MSIIITEYRNASSISADNSRMDVEINHPVYGWVPYTIDASVTEPSVDHASLRSLIGSDYSAYVAPTQEELDAIAASDVRERRDSLLVSQVDPIVSNPLRWADLSAQEQADVSAYRLALLDVPQQQGFPHTVSWPTPPACL